MASAARQNSPTAATRPRASPAGVAAWLLLAALVALPAVPAALRPGSDALLDWQPGLWASEFWRCWSAAWVHYSRLHLSANLAGAALVAALGWAVRVPPRAALAWAMAWPLTHLALLAEPQLLHYGGLSGVLHAGTAVAAVTLAKRAGRGERRLGWAIAGVLVVKLASEAPWRAPLVWPAGWDIAVAPLAHAAGAVAGALLAAWLVPQPRMRRTSAVVE